MSVPICFGDYITLSSNSLNENAYAIESSKEFSSIAISADNPSPDVKKYTPDHNAIAFEILPAYRYKLNKAYRKNKELLKNATSEEKHSISIESYKENAELENEGNKNEKRRLSGKPILYGQMIQLRHAFTNKFLQVNKKETSLTEVSALYIHLNEFTAKETHFVIMPKYKLKTVGDIIQTGDEIVVESFKIPAQYLHNSRIFFPKPSFYAGHSYEMNLSINQTGFIVTVFRKPIRDSIFLFAGQPFRLFHTEIEGTLAAEGVFNEPLTQSSKVHIRSAPKDYYTQLNRSLFLPTTNSSSYWLVEPEETGGGILKGCYIKWYQNCRIKHMCTRSYLYLESNNERLGLISEQDLNTKLKALTIFRLHPAILFVEQGENKQYADNDDYCRIQHASTGRWLHGDGNTFIDHSELETPTSHYQQHQNNANTTTTANTVWKSDPCMESLRGSSKILNGVKSIDEKLFDDVFELQPVSKKDWKDFNYVAGMVPTLQVLKNSIIVSTTNTTLLTDNYMIKIQKSLAELTKFLIVKGVAQDKRQKLLRNLNVVRLLVDILYLADELLKFIYTEQQKKTILLIYDLLCTYLIGDNEQNSYYIAKHLNFFEDQISRPDPIGSTATSLVIGLLKNERKILDRISQQRIDVYLTLLQKKQNYKYMQLLSTLCVCDEIAMCENQRHITDRWLGKLKPEAVRLAVQFVVNREEAVGSFGKGGGGGGGKDNKDKEDKEDKENCNFICKHFMAYMDMDMNKHIVPLPDVTDDEILGDLESNYIQNANINPILMYLIAQLDLLVNLCLNRNQEAIDIITRALSYSSSSLKEAFDFINDTDILNVIRSKYASLIRVLYVDVYPNEPSLLFKNLTFAANTTTTTSNNNNNNNHTNTATVLEKDYHFKSPPPKWTPAFKQWVITYLSTNYTAINANSPSKNILLHEILKIIYHMVTFNVYESRDEIDALYKVLLSVLDVEKDHVASFLLEENNNNKNKNKNKNNNNKTNTNCNFNINAANNNAAVGDQRKERNTEISNLSDKMFLFLKNQRFRCAKNNRVVVNARLEILKILEVFMNLQFNKRIELFLDKFREVYLEEKIKKGAYQTNLKRLLSDDADFALGGDLSKKARELINSIFDKTEYLCGSTTDLELVRILKTLTKYEYNDLISKCIHMINKVYSKKEELFNSAVRAQIVCNENSFNLMMYMEMALPRLRRLIKMKLHKEHVKEIIDILLKFTWFCSTCTNVVVDRSGDMSSSSEINNNNNKYADIIYEPNTLNQNILYTNGILYDCFDILNKKIDHTIMNSSWEYKELEMVFNHTFDLIRSMAVKNVSIQDRLFYRINTLLSIKGAENRMALAVTEIFLNNRDTCLKVTTQHVHSIFMLLEKHRQNVPEFFDILSALIKIESLNLPLKKNQTYVIKYFMQYELKIAEILKRTNMDEKKKILKEHNNNNGGNNEAKYFLSMVKMLATCCEGENRSVESLCQTFFTLPDLLSILNDTELDNCAKKPFMEFFHWAYLQTGFKSMDTQFGKILKVKGMDTFLEYFIKQFQILREYVDANSGDGSGRFIKNILQIASPRGSYYEDKLPSVRMKSGGKVSSVDLGQNNNTTRTTTNINRTSVAVGGSGGGVRNIIKMDDNVYNLHYFFDVVIPFLNRFFNCLLNYKGVNTLQNQTERMAKAFLQFSLSIQSHLRSKYHFNVILSCGEIMLKPTICGDKKMLPKFSNKYNQAAFWDYTNKESLFEMDSTLNLQTSSGGGGNGKQLLEAKEERKLNEEFNNFAINVEALYNGCNTIKEQIGYDSLEAYTELDGDECLPLGGEFQLMVNTFINNNNNKDGGGGGGNCTGDVYELAKKLVKQLEISSRSKTCKYKSERIKISQENLDIKCLKCLRALVHNEIVRLPKQNSSLSNTSYQTSQIYQQQKRITEVQTSLKNYKAHLTALMHLSSEDDNIIREVLALQVVMLVYSCSNNTDIQRTYIEYFNETRETFFISIQNLMQMSINCTKERRTLWSQIREQIADRVQLLTDLRNDAKAGRITSEQVEETFKRQTGTMGANNYSRGGGGGGMVRGNWFVEGSKTKDQLIADKRKRLHNNTTNNPNKKRVQFNTDLLSVPLATGGIAGGNNENGEEILSQMQFHPSDEKCSIELLTKASQKNNDDYLVGNCGAATNKTLTNQQPEADILYQTPSQRWNTAALWSGFREEDFEYKDEKNIALVVKVLGLMCEGENGPMQNYMKEQLENYKSVNIISETCAFLSVIYSVIKPNTIELVTGIFNTLTEFVNGNLKNQQVVYECKLIDYVNFLMNYDVRNCRPMEAVELKRRICLFVVSLIEENHFCNGVEVGVERSVAESLEIEGIFNMCIKCYNLTAPNRMTKKQRRLAKLSSDNSHSSNADIEAQWNRIPEELEQKISTFGFKCYHIICRMLELVEDSYAKKKCILKTENDFIIWSYYEQGTSTIELVNGDNIQRVFFRVKDRLVLRDDIKEKLNYEIDRSTPTNKLRDFLKWSKFIIKHIKYTRQVYENPLKRFFVKFWYEFNVLVIGLSFVIYFVMLATWKKPSGDEYIPNIDRQIVQDALWVLGGMHNFFSSCVVVSYFLTNSPKFPNIKNKFKSMFNKETLQSQLIFLTTPISSEQSEEDNDTNPNKQVKINYLEVKFFSIRTFWYLLICIFSWLGTWYYGYFFIFHLLHLAELNQILKRAIQSVTVNGVSLVWVFLYGFVLLSIYALVSYGFFREIFLQNGHFCGPLYECAISVLHRGLVDGIFDEGQLVIPENIDFKYRIRKAILDLTFFILITTIGLNIVFGIIVDTFSELRDNKWNVDADMNNKCFICSRPSYDFEDHVGGFQHHLEYEHNYWTYLFFFIYLEETNPSDYTCMERYVNNQISKECYDFFPLNRALSLKVEIDENQKIIQELNEKVNYLYDITKRQEKLKEKEREKFEQDKWDKHHKTTTSGTKIVSPTKSTIAIQPKAKNDNKRK